MHVVGGYRTMSPIQVCNGLGAYDAGIVKYRTLRSYFACVAVMASREAATRARGEKVRQVPQVVRPVEVAMLTGTSERIAAQDLKRLSKAGLIERAGEVVQVSTIVLPCASELVECASPSRSWTRPVPVPRAVLRFLASSSRPALTKVLLAHCLRGLSIDRCTGEVRGRGTVKCSWVASTFGLSLRAAKAARASLISIGVMGRDECSTQRKLNRTGAYFELNLAWSRTGSAPRSSENRTDSAPLIERLRTPSDLEYQRTSRPGVLAGPDLKNVRPEDLGKFARMEELFWQAVDRHVVRGSELDALNFVGAAIRARFGKVRDPVRVFVSIVRRGLWSHISCAEEDRARTALARYRERFPEAFRMRLGESSSLGFATFRRPKNGGASGPQLHSPGSYTIIPAIPLGVRCHT
jgi:hypothetical protein